MGFTIIATAGTSILLNENGMNTERIYKVGEGRPNVVDGIKNGEIKKVGASFSMFRFESVTNVAISRILSLMGSRPVISKSIQTRFFSLAFEDNII